MFPVSTRFFFFGKQPENKVPSLVPSMICRVLMSLFVLPLIVDTFRVDFSFQGSFLNLTFFSWDEWFPCILRTRLGDGSPDLFFPLEHFPQIFSRFSGLPYRSLIRPLSSFYAPFPRSVKGMVKLRLPRTSTPFLRPPPTKNYGRFSCLGKKAPFFP